MFYNIHLYVIMELLFLCSLFPCVVPNVHVVELPLKISILKSFHAAWLVMNYFSSVGVKKDFISSSIFLKFYFIILVVLMCIPLPHLQGEPVPPFCSLILLKKKHKR
jgi:hypothetical protein